jgi:BirA family biotin operon repressor/biotin-[acetyl-CoA-carboxylase] ligase
VPNFIYFDEIDSTNNEAKRMLAARRAHGDEIIVARCQTKGRGRFERTWLSGRDQGIYISYLFKLSFSPKTDPNLSLIGCLAAAETLKNLCKLDVRFKWPNDILVKNKKISGVLTEVIGRFCIIGIGINLTTEPTQAVPDLTSIKSEGGSCLDNEKIIEYLTGQVNKYFNLYLQSGSAKILEEYNKYEQFSS